MSPIAKPAARPQSLEVEEAVKQPSPRMSPKLSDRAKDAGSLEPTPTLQGLATAPSPILGASSPTIASTMPAIEVSTRVSTIESGVTATATQAMAVERDARHSAAGEAEAPLKDPALAEPLVPLELFPDGSDESPLPELCMDSPSEDGG